MQYKRVSLGIPEALLISENECIRHVLEVGLVGVIEDRNETIAGLAHNWHHVCDKEVEDEVFHHLRPVESYNPKNPKIVLAGFSYGDTLEEVAFMRDGRVYGYVKNHYTSDENNTHYLIQIENKYPRFFNLRSFVTLGTWTKSSDLSLGKFSQIHYVEKDDFYREANNPGYILVSDDLYWLLDFNYVLQSTQIPVTDSLTYYLVLLGSKS